MKRARFWVLASVVGWCGAVCAQSSVTSLATDDYDGDTLTVEAAI